MKSSSQYFPVTLLKADFWNELSEDIYSLKPNSSEDRTVEFSATRLSAQQYCKQGLQRGCPIIFVHDLFQNRFVWMNDHQDLIDQLTNKGFDVWIMEMRGHGLSKVNVQYVDNNLDDIAKYDLPALQQFVEELNPQPAMWVGLGEGGIAILRSLLSGGMKEQAIHSLHILKLDHWKVLHKNRIPLVPLFKRLLSRKKSFIKETEPEAEPRGVWRQMLKEQAFLGRKRLYDSSKRLRAAIPDLTVRCWFYAKPGQLKRLGKQLADHPTALVVSGEDSFELLSDELNRVEAFPTPQSGLES